MKPIDQALADASNDSYANRSQNDVETRKKVQLDGKWYQVFGYANDPITGFHATAYQNVATGGVIIAYRGTDPGLFSGATKAEKAGHALTTLQDIAVDAKMVRDTVNAQTAAADAFTAQMIAKAARQGILKEHVFAAGHSLGGAVAEIEAAKYGLRGATFNGFGAADLIDGPPQPGFHLSNYRMAGDVVSAASPHLGEVVSLASQEDIQSLRAGRYLDAPAGAPPPNALIAMRLDDHGGQQHFNSKSPDNILHPQRFQEAAQRYAQHQTAIDQFGSDVSRARAELAQSLRQMHGHTGQGQLSPNVQRQVNEVLALQADPSIRAGIERNAPVQGAEHGLLYGAGVAHATGRAAHDLDERVASAAREAGAYGGPVLPLAPLAGGVVGEAAHLHAQAADAAGRFVGDGLQSAKGAVEQGAHDAAEAAVRRLHDPGFQAGAANAVNRIVDTYDAAQVGAHAAEQRYQDVKHAVSQRIEHAENAAMHTYGAARHAVSEGVDRAERAATQTWDATRHAVSQGVDRAEHAATQGYDATQAAGRFVGDGLQSAKSAVEQRAHAAAERQTVVRRLHDPAFQAGAAHVAHRIVDTYDAARVGAQAAEQRYQDARHTVSQGIEHAEKAAMHTYGAAGHAFSQGVERAEHAATQGYDATKQAVSHGIDTAAHAAGQPTTRSLIRGSGSSMTPRPMRPPSRTLLLRRILSRRHTLQPPRPAWHLVTTIRAILPIPIMRSTANCNSAFRMPRKSACCSLPPLAT
ncbi:hypothetical protein [Xanthomonas translucens]|uniref:hypothetical protein n=1 Tax=Xanthomonas campestris pv. translucens TaxID=343 RepID=UPI001F50BC1E|nr:hypothetical protein [Xanthomonas translucens]